MPDWLSWLMLAWFLAISVYSALCAQGTVKPPEWTAPVTPVITIILVAAVWRAWRKAARARKPPAGSDRRSNKHADVVLEREVPLSLAIAGCLAGLFVPLLHLPRMAGDGTPSEPQSADPPGSGSTDLRIPVKCRRQTPRRHFAGADRAAAGHGCSESGRIASFASSKGCLPEKIRT